MSLDRPAFALDDPTEPIVLGPGVELPADLAARVKAEMEPGEKLIWAGKAVPVLPRVGWVTVLIGLVALLLLAGAVANVASYRGLFGQGFAKDPDALIGAMLCFAVGMSLGLAILGARLNRRSTWIREARRLYALTDRLAIVWRPSRANEGVEVHFFERGRIARIHRTELPDGRGDVIFSETGTATVTSLEFLPEPVGFISVSEVKRVEALARSVLLAPLDTAPSSRQALT